MSRCDHAILGKAETSPATVLKGLRLCKGPEKLPSLSFQPEAPKIGILETLLMRSMSTWSSGQVKAVAACLQKLSGLQGA